MGIPEQTVDLQCLTDEALVVFVREGREAAFCELLARYIPFIRKKAGTYGFAGIDPEDMSQEAALGLLSAAKSYSREVGAPFCAYAAVCMERRMMTMYKAATRKKHIPSDQFISLNDTDSAEGAGCCLSSDRASDPEELLIGRENLERVERRIEEILSGMEKNVLFNYLGGASYREIARQLHISEKAVDNALQRVRCKLRKAVF